MEKFNISFKMHPRETGLAAVGAASWCDIKVNKQIIGTIRSRYWMDSNWSTQIKVKSTDPKEWKWVFLKKKDFESMNHAKTFIKENLKAFLEHNKLELYFDKGEK